MMNPPEAAQPKTKKFSISFEVTEGKTTGQIISFDNVSSSITSSISSGALADHSSLSESSESFPHLPVHSSTSTNSSGLSTSRTAKQPAKPCQCCSVLNYLKLNCLCGHGNLLFVRDISSSKNGAEVKEGVRQPEVCSDMDLTDPVISEQTSSSTDATPPENTQDTQPFPRIRLSVRPECNVPMAAEPEEEESEDIPTWWNIPKMEHLMAFPDEVPVYARPPMVPTHYKEDERSRFLTLLWICRLYYAHDTGSEAPQGVTRVFYDPRFEPELPREIYNLLDKFSDNEMVQTLRRFDEILNLAKKHPGWKNYFHVHEEEEVHPTTSGNASPQPTTSTNFAPNQLAMEDFYPTYDYNYATELTTETREGILIEDQTSEIGEGLLIEDQTAETGAGIPIEGQTAGDGGSDGNVTLVYAKFQKWYYPGVVECSVEEWDNATQPITVQFYDGSPKKDLSPDMIFPLQRLPPGANIQLQRESSVYIDVFYMSFEPSVDDFGMPSATVHILSESSPVTSVSFSVTALSPKDVVQTRSALKSAFYPSRSRMNFTELTAESILGYSSRRRPRVEAAASEDQKKKAEQTAPSPPKRQKIELASTPVAEPSTQTPLVEPSSTEHSFTSPEESPNVAYVCTAAGCGMQFDSEQHLLAHREDVKKSKKRQHTTMRVVPREVHKRSSVRKAAMSKVDGAGPSRTGGSRFVRIQLPQTQKVPISDSETDTGSSLGTYRWSQFVQGFGLRPEKCELSDTVKSFTKLKGERKAKCPPRTGIFSSQHFILTNGPPHMFTKSRKRAANSESEESTDVEYYYATSLVFDVLKLQKSIECGGGRVYSDFSDVPADLCKNPGHELIVVSSHPTCTANYIYGVSLGCTIVRHDTILDCVRKRTSLKKAISSGSAMLLPPGWCEQKKTWAPLRASRVKPLKNLKFFVALRCNQDSKSFWCSLILQLGGKPITIEENHQLFAMLDRSIFGIVADPEVAPSLVHRANQKGVPIVNTAWIIQAVITGSQPPVSSYKVTIEDSSF